MRNSIYNTLYSILTTKTAIILALAIACLTLPQVVQAATYYVDINGVGEDGIPGTADDVVSSDTNPGTSDAPWKTIARAQNYNAGYIPSGYNPMVQPGDTVIVRNGNYGEFRESASDNPSYKWHIHRTDWITYKAAAGHTPVLSNININNRDPANPPNYTPGGESYLVFDGFRISEGANFQKTSYVQARNCDITLKAELYEGLYAPYYPANSAAIGSVDANYVTIQNCNIHNCNDGIKPSGEYWTIKGNKIHRFGDDGIHGVPKHSVTEGNNIFDCDKYRSSIEIYGSSITGTFEVGEIVIMSRSDGTEALGIFRSLWSGPNTIDIYQTTAVEFRDGSVPAGTTVIGQKSGAIISGITRVDPQHTDGIQSHSSDTSDVVIKSNNIHSGMWDGIKLATYTGGVVKDVTIANNLLYDTDGYAIFMGAEPLSGAGGTYQNINVYNNTFYGEAQSGGSGSRLLHLRNSAKIDNLYNNIITNLVIDSNAGGVVNHGSNIFRENPDGKGPVENKFYMNSTELFNANPGFVGAANGDFRLTEQSIARDFGNANYAPLTDIIGNTRDAQPDAGCYEYGSTPSTNGDINSDGSVDAIDLQLLINMILSGGFDSKADLNKDSSVDAVDLQALVNIILG